MLEAQPAPRDLGGRLLAQAVAAVRDGQCAVRVDLERLHRVVQGAVPVLEIKGVGELAVRGLFGAAEEGPELQPDELGDQRRPCTAERRQLRGEGLDDLVELDLIGLGQRAEETDPVGVRLPTGAQGRALSADEATRLARVFKALGDPARLRMASLIAAQPEVCVCDISPAFDLSPGTISHHLKQLREAGLVSSERRGTYVWYRINPEALGALSALLAVPTPA